MIASISIGRPQFRSICILVLYGPMVRVCSIFSRISSDDSSTRIDLAVATISPIRSVTRAMPWLLAISRSAVRSNAAPSPLKGTFQINFSHRP